MVLIATRPYVLSRNTKSEFTRIFEGQEYPEAFRTLKAHLKSLEVSVPTLYKQYEDICELGGVQFSDFRETFCKKNRHG